jgi:hypothetical protein
VPRGRARDWTPASTETHTARPLRWSHGWATIADVRDEDGGDVDAGGWSPGRIGSWHSYRWLWWLASAVLAVAVPWPVVPTQNRAPVLVGALLLGTLWAVPVWRCGIVADERGVRCTGIVRTRHYRWEDILGADLGWRSLEPRLLLELTDDVIVVPGLRVPQSKAYRRDLWRDSRMFDAAEAISAEARRRRAEGVAAPRRAEAVGVPDRERARGVAAPPRGVETTPQATW